MSRAIPLAPQKYQEPYTPGVIFFRILCGIQAASYLLGLVIAFIYGIIIFVALFSSYISKAHIDKGELDAMLIVFLLLFFYILITSILFFVYLRGFFLKRKPSSWIYGLVLIIFSFVPCSIYSFCISLPLGITTLVLWLQERTQIFYGKSSSSLSVPQNPPQPV